MKVQDARFVKEPKVSVVICAYNRETTIGQTINSVLQQRCNFPIEVIIGEDCGTDRTRDICINFQRKYPETIKLFLHEENCGPGKNWAVLVKESRGEFIASCDDDDYWHNENKLQLQIEHMEANRDYGVVHTEYDVLYVKRNKLIKNYLTKKNIRIPDDYTMRDIFYGRVNICASTSCIRKELIDKFVPLDDYIRYKFGIQDWPTWLILSKYSKIGYLPVSTTTYRIGHFAISNLKSYEKIENKLSTDQVMYKYLCEMFPYDLDYNEKNYDVYKNMVLLNHAYIRMDIKNARKYAKRLRTNGVFLKKVTITQNSLLFYIFSILKRMRNLFYY
jgi:glycosyltransferase involved in cell wall biosynthesis